MTKARDLADLGGVTTRLDEVGNTDGALSNRNLIINGAMQVAQRGTSATAGGYVSLDRYQSLSTGGGAYTFSQETDTPSGQGFKNSAKVTVDTADSSIAAGDYYHLQQNIEGQNIAHLMQGTSDAIKVTLSFWVKSSLTGDFGGALRNDDGSRTRPFQYNISSADTWQKVTKTIQLDTSGTWLTTDETGLRVGFDLGSGATYQGASDAWASANYLTQSGSVQLIGTSSATWYITGVQLEVGDQATSFEHPRSYGDELARCQRFYCKSSPNPASDTWYTEGGGFLCVDMEDLAMGGVSWPVEMRATPTVVGYAAGTANAIKSYGGNATRNITGYRRSKSGWNSASHDGGYNFGRPYTCTWTADAEL